MYNLLYESGSFKLGIIDDDRNNILHLAATKPMQSRLNIVLGAALQMQREILLFEVHIFTLVIAHWFHSHNFIGI